MAVTILGLKHIRYDEFDRDVVRLFIAVANVSELPTKYSMNNLVISEASKAWDISSGAIYGFTDADGWVEQPTAVGSVIKLKGRVNTVNDLPPVAEEGWLYFVGASSATEFEEYIYTSDGRWEALGYSGITVDAALSDTSENPVQNKVVTLALAGKVDKVNGKGLSTNDYDNTEKANLASVVSTVAPISESEYAALVTKDRSIYFIYDDEVAP